jgi:hypothetical protein
MTIAAVATLAPAAAASADGYPIDEFPCAVSVPGEVTVGEEFTVSGDCPDDMAGDSVTATITPNGTSAPADGAVEVAGTSSEAFTLDENGDFVATASVSAPGDYTFQLWNASGEPISAAVTFTAFAAGVDDGLAVTGPTSLPYLGIAGGLLLLGVVALVATRIRVRRA